MGKTASKDLVQWVVALLFIALVNGAMGMFICNIDTSQMNLCMPAVNGMSPAPPTKECCAVVSGAKLPCLCSFRNLLPAFGINPRHALALPMKCGLETPLECQVT